jgi:hypothetical protein
MWNNERGTTNNQGTIRDFIALCALPIAALDKRPCHAATLLHTRRAGRRNNQGLFVVYWRIEQGMKTLLSVVKGLLS